MMKLLSWRCNGRNMAGVAMIMVLGIFMMMVGNGWAQDTSCLNQLVPCLNYLNGTRNVPDSCCNPLRNVIESNPECLCSMISNRGSRQAEQAGIDVNEAQQLPARCGQHVNPLACLTGSGNTGDNSGSYSMIHSESMKMVVVLGLCMSMIVVQMLWF